MSHVDRRGKKTLSTLTLIQHCGVFTRVCCAIGPSIAVLVLSLAQLLVGTWGGLQKPVDQEKEANTDSGDVALHGKKDLESKSVLVMMFDLLLSGMRRSKSRGSLGGPRKLTSLR